MWGERDRQLDATAHNLRENTSHEQLFELGQNRRTRAA
jgi:hypothetical protein